MKEDDIICVESRAFYTLIDRVVTYIKDVHGLKNDKWIDDRQAMEMLGITSRTTLQKLRNEGKIKFTQPMKKVVLYERDSIEKYLNQNIRNTF